MLNAIKNAKKPKEDKRDNPERSTDTEGQSSTGTDEGESVLSKPLSINQSPDTDGRTAKHAEKKITDNH